MNPSPHPAPFTSAHGRALITKILLIIGAVVSGMSLLAAALSLAFPPLTDDQEPGDNPAGAVVSIMIFLIVLLEIIVYLTTVVFFLMWLYRAHGNLQALNPRCRLNYSRGLTLGSFFIPFANLVIPYRAVTEVWQNSGPPDEALLSEPHPPARFPIWWTFWLLASFAGQLSYRIEHVPESTATMISMVASALSIGAAVFAYLVVDAIDKRQEETSGKLRLTEFSAPPPPPANLSMSNEVAAAPLQNEET